MNKKTILLTMLLVLLIGTALFFYRTLGIGLQGDGPTTVAPPAADSSTAAPDASEREEERVKIPGDLSFLNSEGETVTMDDFTGKPLVINFWASWCGYCREEMPDFKTVYQEFGDQVQFVMLNATDPAQGETQEVAQQYFAKNDLQVLPLYFDAIDRQVSRAFGVSGLPMTFFIDSEGYLVAYEPGMTNAERLRKGIEMIQNVTPEPIAATAGSFDTSSEEVLNPSWCTVEPIYQKIDAESAKNIIDEFQEEDGLVILDVRTEEEYLERRIPKSVLIPHDALAGRAEAELPDKRDVILVYCRTGRRSEEAANALVTLGYNHVYDFGGIIDWPYETEAG